MENYEKKYKDALSYAKSLITEVDDKGRVYYVDDIKNIFPELAESKDEKIRKTIVSVLEQNIRAGFDHSNGFKFTELITWLERQCEKKLTEYMDEIKIIKEEIKKRIARQQEWINAHYGDCEQGEGLRNISVQEELKEVLSFIESLPVR